MKRDNNCMVCSVDVSEERPNGEGGYITTEIGNLYCSLSCLAMVEPTHEFLFEDKGAKPTL